MLAPKLTINRQEKERTLDPKEAVKDEYLEEFHTVVWEIQCRGIYWFTLKYIGWFNVKEFKELFFVLIKYHLFLVVILVVGNLMSSLKSFQFQDVE